MYGQIDVKSYGLNNARDLYETEMFANAIKYGIPMLGICRGAQFLTVMNGGSLIQDVNHHTGNHGIKLSKTDAPDNWKKGYSMNVTSTHHQMMDPAKTLNKSEYKIIGYALGLSDHYMIEENGKAFNCLDRMIEDYGVDVDGKTVVGEPEIVFYPNTKCLCMQFHPEYVAFKGLKFSSEDNRHDGESSIVVRDLINKLLIN
jgi:carbamoylphosphate synthase small subunit